MTLPPPVPRTTSTLLPAYMMLLSKRLSAAWCIPVKLPPPVGWNHSQALARVANTHLVTQIRNRPNILEAGLVEGQDFTAIDSDLVEKPVMWAIAQVGASVQSGKGWTTQTAASALTYQYFERLIWRCFGRHARS